MRARRSELATPASSERMCEKAPSSGADLVFLDLEDACAPVAKEGALGALANSRPGVKARERDWELEAARADPARLGEGLRGRAVQLMLVEGKGGGGGVAGRGVGRGPPRQPRPAPSGPGGPAPVRRSSALCRRPRPTRPSRRARPPRRRRPRPRRPQTRQKRQQRFIHGLGRPCQFARLQTNRLHAAEPGNDRQVVRDQGPAQVPARPAPAREQPAVLHGLSRTGQPCCRKDAAGRRHRQAHEATRGASCIPRPTRPGWAGRRRVQALACAGKSGRTLR